MGFIDVLAGCVLRTGIFHSFRGTKAQETNMTMRSQDLRSDSTSRKNPNPVYNRPQREAKRDKETLKILENTNDVKQPSTESLAGKNVKETFVLLEVTGMQHPSVKETAKRPCCFQN